MALRNAQYHAARRRFLDAVSKLFNFVIILAGTGTAAQLSEGRPDVSIFLGGAIAGLGAAQLVFDFTGRARAHEILQRRYFSLLADIEETLDPDEQQCARWKSEFSRAAADEPPVLRALDAISDNQATAALLGASKPRLKVTFWQSITRQIFAHNAGTFPVSESWSKTDQEALEGNT